MSRSEYTPTTEEVRHAYYSHTSYERMLRGDDVQVTGEFDRWLRKVQAEALRDVAIRVRYEVGTEASGHTSTYSVRRWLNAEADRIEKDLQST